MTIHNEQGLVSAFKRGDRGAFDLLWKQHGPAISRYVRSRINPDDARDVLQETAIRAYKYRNGFKEKASFLTWVLRIASKEIARAHENNAKHPTLSLEAGLEEEGGCQQIRVAFSSAVSPCACAMLFMLELQQVMWDSLAAYPRAADRESFLAMERDGHSDVQIAKRKGITPVGVRAEVSRVRTFVRDTMERYVEM